MTDDFQRRLQSAIQRGERRGERQVQSARQSQLSEEECKRLHTKYRLSLSDRIEHAIDGVAQHFPGFRKETLYGEVGWGAACWRDNLQVESGKRSNLYSRLEMTIRPPSSYNVLELKGKGTIANKEVFNRTHFVPLQEVDEDDFVRLIDTWAIDYAEIYAAKQ
ncbi:MAG: hypothetical protein ACO1RT_11800 [Planctomycetaceae bacterium]